MGAWGYDPKDNDGAWDLLGGVESAMRPALIELGKKKFTGSYALDEGYSRAGVAQILLERGFTIPYELLAQAIRDIDRCIANQEWIERWRVPLRMSRRLPKMRAAFAALEERRWPRMPKRRRGLRRQRRGATIRARFYEVSAPKGWPRILPSQQRWVAKKAKRFGRNVITKRKPKAKRRRLKGRVALPPAWLAARRRLIRSRKRAVLVRRRVAR